MDLRFWGLLGARGPPHCAPLRQPLCRKAESVAVRAGVSDLRLQVRAGGEGAILLLSNQSPEILRRWACHV